MQTSESTEGGERERGTLRAHLLFPILQGAGIQSVRSCSLLSRKHLKVTWCDFPSDSGTKGGKEHTGLHSYKKGKKPSPTRGKGDHESLATNREQRSQREQL